MKVLVLGCGEMGESVIDDLYYYGEFHEIVVGSRHLSKASRVLDGCKGKNIKISAVEINAENIVELEKMMKGVDVVVNCIGPNYKYEVPIARAAIQAKVNLVDINDDYETTCQMLALDEKARDAGITVILGMGASPGVNNILVRAAVDQLDSVEKIHTAWVMSAADPGGLALSYHLLYSLSHKALTFRDGKMIQVQSFVDGKERIEFPDPIGEMDVYHVGHPEPITLSRFFKGVKYVDDKATFNPPIVNDLILSLAKMVREAPRPVQFNSMEIDPMDFAASYLNQRCKSMKGIPKEGALRVKVEGTKGGKKRSVLFSSSARIASGTGIPASIGAIMLARGEIELKGVLPPEECINPHDFIYEVVNRRNVAKLNGWIEE
jgi:saccharopine dehydrogenase-like NADP-dependent oxidoreductase